MEGAAIVVVVCECTLLNFVLVKRSVLRVLVGQFFSLTFILHS